MTELGEPGTRNATITPDRPRTWDSHPGPGVGKVPAQTPRKKHLSPEPGRLPSCTLFCHQTSCWVPRGFCPPTKAEGHGASGS